MTAAGTGAAALWTGTAPVVVAISVAALGLGVCLVTSITVAVGNIEPAVAGIGSAIVNTFHELGGAVGVAVLSSAAAASLGATPPGTTGFSRGFLVAAVVALVAAVAAIFLVPPGRPLHATTPHAH